METSAEPRAAVFVTPRHLPPRHGSAPRVCRLWWPGTYPPLATTAGRFAVAEARQPPRDHSRSVRGLGGPPAASGGPAGRPAQGIQTAPGARDYANERLFLPQRYTTRSARREPHGPMSVCAPWRYTNCEASPAATKLRTLTTLQPPCDPPSSPSSTTWPAASTVSPPASSSWTPVSPTASWVGSSHRGVSQACTGASTSWGP